MKKKDNDSRRQEVEGKLLSLSGLDLKDLFEKYGVDEYGLDPVQASDRLDEYGRNIIDFGKEKSLAVRIKDAIINPFNIVLLVVAAITFVTDVILADEPSFATFLMLVAVIIISAAISFCFFNNKISCKVFKMFRIVESMRYSINIRYYIINIV